MQLTRAVLTITLATSAASALPRYEPGDYAIAQERQQATLEAGLNGIHKRSHTSAYPHMQLGFGLGDGTEEGSRLNPNSQKGTMGQLQSVAADKVECFGNDQSINHFLSTSGMGAGRSVHGMKNPGSPASTGSSAFNVEPLAQQSSLEKESQGVIDMGSNAIVPVSDTNAPVSKKNQTALQTARANQAKQLKNNTGFTRNVRELISSFVRNQKQGHTEQGIQQQQQHGSEDSIGIHQDRGYAEILSGKLHATNMGQQSGMDQIQSSDESSTVMPDTKEHKAMYQEMSQMSVPQTEHSNRKATQTHPDKSIAGASYREDLAQTNNQKQTMGHRVEQQMQQQQQQQQM